MANSGKLARETLKVDPVNDGRHVLPDVAMARESSPYLVYLPDEKIGAFTYTWVNKDGVAGAALAIFGPGVGDKPIEQWISDVQVPADMDWNDWKVGAYWMSQDLKFDRASVKWETPEASLAFEYKAFHPPYAYGSHAGGCPSYTATNRIEQSGSIKGQFTLGDRVIPFDTVGHRDHSWGTRDWGAFQAYNWFQGQTTDGVSVHWWRFWALGKEHLRGYVFKDGLLAEVTEVKNDIVLDDVLWHQTLTATILDEAGRTTTVTADFASHYTLIPSDTLHLREGAGRATYDGKPGVGWLEMAWPPAYLAYVAANGPY